MIDSAGAGAAAGLAVSVVVVVVVVWAQTEQDMRVAIREKVIFLSIADCFGE